MQVLSLTRDYFRLRKPLDAVSTNSPRNLGVHSRNGGITCLCFPIKQGSWAPLKKFRYLL